MLRLRVLVVMEHSSGSEASIKHMPQGIAKASMPKFTGAVVRNRVFSLLLELAPLYDGTCARPLSTLFQSSVLTVCVWL
jgi:hypothetical protein